MSRLQSVKLLDEVFPFPLRRQKEIDKCLASTFGIWNDEQNMQPERVELRFPPNFAFLEEHVFHHTQKIARDAKGNYRLSLKVPLTLDLRQWVLSWMDSVTVLGPERLRKELGEFGVRLKGRCG